MVPDSKADGLRRRRFLQIAAGGAVAGVAGCLGGGKEPVLSSEKSFTIEEREWASLEFSLGNHGRVEYEATVRDGPAVDFLVMHSVEYEKYEEQELFDFVQYVSRLDTFDAAVDEKVSPGDFVFLVDNTNEIGALLPNDGSNPVATVDVTLDVYRG